MDYNNFLKINPFTGKLYTETTQPIQPIILEDMGDEAQQRMISRIRNYLIYLPCDNKMENHNKKSCDFRELLTRPKINNYFYNRDIMYRNQCTHFNLNYKYAVIKQPDGFMQCQICNRKWTKEAAKMELNMLNNIMLSNFKIELTSIKNKAYTKFSTRKKLDRLVYRDKYTNRLICEQIEDICMRDFQYHDNIKQVRYLNFITGETKTIIEETKREVD